MPKGRLKKIAIASIALGLILALLGIVGAYFFTFPDIQLERVSFSTAPYESPPHRVSGLLFIPDHPIAEPTPAVIFSHGLTQSKEAYFSPCRELARRGVIVLAIDLRGHGSTGGVNDFGYSEMIDVWAAADYLASREDVDGERIAATGHSLGGMASTRAGIFQSDQKIKAVAAVWCTPSIEETMELTYGPIDNFLGRVWPHLAVSRRFDINSPADRKKREVKQHVTLERPPNYLLVIGSREAEGTVPQQKEVMRKATGTADVVPGRTYGSFEEGTARKFVVTKDTHLTEMISPKVWNAVYSWIFEAFGLKDPSPVGNELSYRVLFQALVLVGFLLVALGLFYAIRLFLGEKSDGWELSISPDRSRDYRWIAAFSVLLFLGASYGALPLTRLLGIRAFIPFSFVPFVLGADLLANIAAGVILLLLLAFPATFALARRWDLAPFNRPIRLREVFYPEDHSVGKKEPDATSPNESPGGLGPKTPWARLLLGTAPFALFLLLYSTTAYGLHLVRGVPISIPGFLSLTAVLTAYFYLSGHYLHAFLLPSWGNLKSRWHRISYMVSEAGVRALGLAVAFLPVVSNPLVSIGSPIARTKLLLILSMAVIGFLVFLPVSALTLSFRRRGYGVFASSITMALFVSWVYATYFAVRFF